MPASGEITNARHMYQLPHLSPVRVRIRMDLRATSLESSKRNLLVSYESASMMFMLVGFTERVNKRDNGTELYHSEYNTGVS